MELLLGLLLLAAVYLYGCKVGRDAGIKLGRAQADAEWGRMLEHGMVGPTVDLIDTLDGRGAE